ncbi:MAG TPA: RbsD/FucU domain-containing protein, partial [Devosia sp.]|nr:RbsD/FucU domain-containing protein [Devosia sp.]
MLKNIPPLLGPDLLAILRAMGHGDEIAIVDANYPADSAGPLLVRLDGISATEILDAV